MLTRSDLQPGDRLVVTCSTDDGDTEEYAGEVTGIDGHHIRIDPASSIATRIRVGVDGNGRPRGAEIVTSHRKLTREVERLELK
ncbi:hypothetical protein BDK61_1457 [Haloarcula quadrata]|uniref:Uncharacterized protein n=1 Tax=Haloarcula quadrata TaxID=182779 RepID=A0A495R5K3_9EURY|nr:hypothetical protein [Haloarcula quadrata]RKS82158.1 hypothetical protein BDK61_1457 [Haloarcula quadrata]